MKINKQMASTPADDLSIGDWVVVVAELERDYNGDYRFDSHDMTGNPFKVISIALPFLCVDCLDGHRTTLDVRELQLRKVHDHYVEAMKIAIKQRSENSNKESDKTLTKDELKPGCPRCGEEMQRQTIIAFGDNNKRSAQNRMVCRCGIVVVLPSD